MTDLCDDIRAALDGTTPGPWKVGDDTRTHMIESPSGDLIAVLPYVYADRDAELVAAAPVLLERALVEIERLTSDPNTTATRLAALTDRDLYNELIRRDVLRCDYELGAVKNPDPAGEWVACEAHPEMVCEAVIVRSLDWAYEQHAAAVQSPDSDPPAVVTPCTDPGCPHPGDCFGVTVGNRTTWRWPRVLVDQYHPNAQWPALVSDPDRSDR